LSEAIAHFKTALVKTALARRVPTADARPSRIRALDAVRGIAALQVVLTHCIDTVPAAHALEYAGATALLAPLIGGKEGRAAVIVFFVLSGFVLSLWPVIGYRGYGSYLVRRFCRIYLPFAAVILVCALVASRLPLEPVTGLQSWFNWLWSEPVDGRRLLGNLVMTNRWRDVNLNPSMWSLAYELRISLIFPALVLLTRRVPAAALAGGIALSLGCELLSWRLLPDRGAIYVDGNPLEALIHTTYFAVFFVAGIVSALFAGDVGAWLAKRRWASIALAVTAWLAFCWPANRLLSDFSYAVGACAVIALAIGAPRVAAFLEAQPLQWLGRVSYSLYLVHLPVLIVGVHLLHDRMPLVLVLGTSVLAALVAAELCCRYVEQPAARVGRRLSRLLNINPAVAVGG